MKRILHISKYYHPFVGGVEQVASDCVNALNNDYEQKVICFNHQKGNVTDKVDNVEVIRVNCQAKIASQSIALSYSKQLKKLMKEFKPDIVIFHYPNPFVAHFLMKHLKNKTFTFILYWHLDITKQKILGKIFKGQNTRLLKYADKIIATSPNYIDGSPWLSKYKEKCVVVPCCINEERLKINDNVIEKTNEIKKKYFGKTICFAFGRHVEYKGLTYLIKASKLLNDDYVVLIGGHGPLTDELIKEAKDDKKIIFLGKISDDDLKAYLNACDIFCFPSITKNEAFGIGLAEAMYFGKPAVTFTIPGSGVNYVSINGETGIEVPNKDYVEFAKAIEKIKDDARMYQILSENSKRRIENNLLYSMMKDRLLRNIK